MERETCVSGKCRGYRGDEVISEIRAYGDKLHTCDRGIDLESGKMVWGSTELYRFKPVWANGSAVEPYSFTPSRSGVRSPLRP